MKTKHFKARLVKNTIINFETKPTVGTMLDYEKNGIDSKIVKELIEFIYMLKQENKVQTVELRSFLLRGKFSKPVREAIENNFDTKCEFIKANFWLDTLPFIATSLVLLDLKNICRISTRTGKCIITL